MCCGEWTEKIRCSLYSLCSIMSVNNIGAILVLLVIHICSRVSDGGNLTENLSQDRPVSPAVVMDSSGFQLSPVSLSSSFPEDLEISNYCSDLLHIFQQRYVSYVDCLVPAARPVKVCQNCFSSYSSLVDIYTNISSDQVFKVGLHVFLSLWMVFMTKQCQCWSHDNQKRRSFQSRTFFKI